MAPMERPRGEINLQLRSARWKHCPTGKLGKHFIRIRLAVSQMRR
jgi:hypothetical protein